MIVIFSFWRDEFIVAQFELLISASARLDEIRDSAYQILDSLPDFVSEGIDTIRFSVQNEIFKGEIHETKNVQH